MSIAATEFARRRRQLMRMAGEDAVVIVAAAPVRLRNADVTWPYRQDSDFHYLSGFPEPDAVLALLPGRAHGEAVLFCRERDAAHERWHGELLGPARAVADYGMDDAFPVDDIDDILPGMMEGRTRVYCNHGREPAFDERLQGWMRRLAGMRGGGVVPRDFAQLGHLLHDLRLFKSRAEMALLREAAAITVAAHRAAWAAARPGCREYEVEAELVHAMRRRGAVPAFQPTVASGRAACTLHYHAGRGVLGPSDLLLVDAGAEWECYAADVCRTIPVGGRYGPAQRALYDVVREARLAALEQVRPGQPFDAAHRAAVRTLAGGLCRLGLLDGGVDVALRSGALRRFVPAKTAHWLGLDVHDVGDYRVDGQSRVLEAGMVLAVEPGVYIPPDDASVDARWRGIGIRIEDDVAVTADGHEVLTSALPGDPEAIEAVLAAR